MSVWVQILLTIAFVSLIVVLISQNRHPVRTLAWILILCLIPVLGLVLYLVFGTEKKRSRLVSDSRLSSIKEKAAAVNESMVRRNVPDGHDDIASLLWTTNRAIPMAGNDVRVFTRFDDMFESLMEDIYSAKDHVHFEFFKFEDDPIGRRIGELLIELAQRGVEVRVTYDSAANLTRGRFYRWLRKGGVKVHSFLPVIVPFLSTSTNYRNHRKLVVIDGRIGYTGGMNIAERYSSGVHGGIWRDTHIRVEGPAAAEMQTAFIVNWQFCSKEQLDGDRYFPAINSMGDSVLQVATSGPMDEWNVTMQGMTRMITQARDYVYIESPYLIPTESVLMALRNAALSGTDVRIIIPYRGDKGVLVPLASRSYVEECLVAGVRIFFYGGGYMHSKTIVSDDSIATVGSTNLDVRSFEQDFEINAFIYDRDVTMELKRAFLDDQANSREVFLKEWTERSRWERFKESFARIFSLIL
jgi:Phosphatidylserine/phosphatidylglycerophosphate/cardiolipin synthases and related enzymes